MKENIEKECGACPFFKFCAAYIIEEKLGKNWCILFCFADCGKCDHHKYRKSPAFQKSREQALSRIGASPSEILKWP